jgi:hypothetical protein
VSLSSGPHSKVKQEAVAVEDAGRVCFPLNCLASNGPSCLIMMRPNSLDNSIKCVLRRIGQCFCSLKVRKLRLIVHNVETSDVSTVSHLCAQCLLFLHLLVVLVCRCLSSARVTFQTK